MQRWYNFRSVLAAGLCVSAWLGIAGCVAAAELGVEDFDFGPPLGSAGAKNRSYSQNGANKDQGHEPFVIRKDLEGLMASSCPVSSASALLPRSRLAADKPAAGRRTDSNDAFSWTWHPGENRLEARSVNKSGVEGPVSTVALNVSK